MSVWSFGWVQWGTCAHVRIGCGHWGTRAQAFARVSWVVGRHIFFSHLHVYLVVIPCPSPLLSSVACLMTPGPTRQYTKIDTNIEERMKHWTMCTMRKFWVCELDFEIVSSKFWLFTRLEVIEFNRNNLNHVPWSAYITSTC